MRLSAYLSLQGFICPDCMQSFFTAQGLSVHFEEAHGIKVGLFLVILRSHIGCSVILSLILYMCPVSVAARCGPVYSRGW